MTVWGSWSGPSSNRFRVGIELSVSGTTITARYRVECTSSVSDNQTLHRTGAITGTTNYRLENPNQTNKVYLITTQTRTGTRGSTYTFGASISGIYNGATPSVSGVKITVPALAPAKPAKPTVSNVTSSTARGYLASAPNNNGASINAYGWQAEGGPSATLTSGGRTWNVSGLTPAKTYRVRVRARNSVGWGSYSDWSSSFTTPPAVPGAPGTPTVSSVTQTSARIQFSAAATNGASITDYQIQRATNSGFTSGTATNTANNRDRTWSGFSRATTYWVRVRARNSAGWGPYSAARQFTTLPDPPTMGASPNASSITRNSAVLTGFTVSDNGGQSPSNLRVQYNTSPSTSGALVETRGAWAAVTLKGLAADTTYHYRSAAYNSGGWGGYNAWKSFSTLADAPDDMGPPIVVAVDDTSFTLEWAPPNMHGATFTAYEIEVSTVDSFSTVLQRVQKAEPTITQSGLTPGTTYYARARALATPNSGGWGAGPVTTTGVAPYSGMRAYVFVGGVRRRGELYTFQDGVRKKLRPMVQLGGELKSE